VAPEIDFDSAAKLSFRLLSPGWGWSLKLVVGSLSYWLAFGFGRSRRCLLEKAASLRRQPHWRCCTCSGSSLSAQFCGQLRFAGGTDDFRPREGCCPCKNLSNSCWPMQLSRGWIGARSPLLSGFQTAGAAGNSAAACALQICGKFKFYFNRRRK